MYWHFVVCQRKRRIRVPQAIKHTLLFSLCVIQQAVFFQKAFKHFLETCWLFFVACSKHIVIVFWHYELFEWFSNAVVNIVVALCYAFQRFNRSQHSNNSARACFATYR